MSDYFAELSRASGWVDPLPSAGTPRLRYLDRVLSYSGNKLVKLLVGSRGVGKSYLLRALLLDVRRRGIPAANVLYINRCFTDSGVVTHREGLEQLLRLYLERMKPIGKIYLFIEEVQNVAEWREFVLAHAQDSHTSIEIFVSGSRREMLDHSSGSLLCGKAVSFEIFPFGYDEYCAYHRCEATRKSYVDYLTGGSFPRLWAQPDRELRCDHLSQLMNTALLRECMYKHRIQDGALLEEVLAFLLSRLSELTAISDIVDHFAAQQRTIAYSTLTRYVAYLVDSFLLHEAARCKIPHGQVVTASSRYYVGDWAFMTFLYPFFADRTGAMLRNAVYLELRRAGYEASVGMYRTSVVDFWARRGDRVLYLQCVPTMPADPTERTELYDSLRIIPDNYEKFIVTLDAELFPSQQGIRNIQAWNLLDLLA